MLRNDRSLGIRTDLLFHRFDGQVIERPDYLVIRTSTNPGVFFGNLLIFSGPPTPQDAIAWPALCRQVDFTVTERHHAVFRRDP